VFVPDATAETFEESTDHGGRDGIDDEGLPLVRAVRYLEWTWDPDPSDTSYLTDYAYLLRMADGTMRVEHDRHVEGLFARADWLRLLSAAGFEPRAVRFDHSELEPGSYEIFVASRPAAQG